MGKLLRKSSGAWEKRFDVMGWETRILLSGLNNKVEIENPGQLAGFGRKMLNSILRC